MSNKGILPGLDMFDRRSGPDTVQGLTVLVLVGIQPMRFRGTCDTCGTREGPFEGERATVAGDLSARGWRYEEGAGGKLTCADCAGPPSVFPAGQLTASARLCTACGSPAGLCVACRTRFEPTDVISCRRQHGHAHARCSTQRMKKLDLPEE